MARVLKDTKIVTQEELLMSQVIQLDAAISNCRLRLGNMAIEAARINH